MTYAIKIYNHKGNDFNSGAPLLWKGLTLAQAKGICSDPRTKGQNFFLGYVDEVDLAAGCKVVKDDGRFDDVLRYFGVL